MKKAVTDNNKEIILTEMHHKKDLSLASLKKYFIHILCKKGTCSFKLEGKLNQVIKNGIAILLPGAAITDLKCSKDFNATCLFISFDIMNKNNPDIGWGIKGYLFSKENPVVVLAETDVRKCLKNFKLLLEKYEDENHQFRKEVLDHQLQIFILDMWSIFSKEMDKRRITNQKGNLFERFLQLVQEHCMEEREVDFYSAKLFITSKYLTEVCKNNSDKTASEWIHNFTTQRLLMLLQNKDLTFIQIADTLNFSSQSFFSRYVKKILGVSPSEYRMRLD